MKSIIKFLTTKSINRLDVFTLLYSVPLFVKGHWRFALIVVIFGMIISVVLETIADILD